MQYSEVKLKIATRDAETAAAIANLVVPYGLYIEDYSDIEELAPQIAHVDLIEQELLERDREHAVIHFYIAPEENPMEAVSFVSERLGAAGIGFSVESEKVDEEDWATAWKKYYYPTKVGGRLVVCPSWETYAPKPGEVVLTMDPGMAFGTGTHDTTRLCMQLLEKYVSPGAHLLDVGTGSGILAVAALLLGAESAVGIDIDEVAVRVAKENAEANGVADRVEFLAGDLTAKVDGKFAVVTANIVADVIIRLIPDLERFLRPDSVFIASGIIDTRAGDVTGALAAAGYEVAERRESGGWVALAAKQRG
ncbi:50S ribosomal protein L11 methyltransferase [Anaerotruncus rubiinfantis]|uniref:50S ribosomal protein L11 methyltransferase n=1 Tax=Anaerotruncus rubiinfantis TaxID=1720200 RepID=UPI0034A204C2